MLATLTINNCSAVDDGWSAVIVSNFNSAATPQVQWATSSVISLAYYPALAGSYAATVTNSAYGAVAFWPLNESTTHPSTGTAVAYDVIGGNNGIYGTNAQNGSANAALLPL